MHVITLAFVTSSLPLHCSNPTYNTLLFLQTSDILLFEEANKLYWNPPIKLYPTPDKPYTRSTPHLTSTTLNVPYTWQCCTCCAKHLANYTHCALHLTNTAVPNLKKKKKPKKKNPPLSVLYTWRTLHSLCPAPDEHYLLCPTPDKHYTHCALHPTNIILVFAPVPNMLWQLDHSCPRFAAGATANTGHTLVQI